ncbi:MAG: alpha/beta hydrolase [Enhydrobacter sp.]|nr:MAG: alpha/beta hydrolase [Enhydrobacter sp.]
MKSIRTKTLEIAYEEQGPADGSPVILLHGFPYDGRAYDEVAPPLAKDGNRVLVPWLRGYGATRFLAPETPRSGEQAALGNDLREFMDALGIARATLGGYDWGGRAACVVSALWPERVRGLVSGGGYNIFVTAAMNNPASAMQEQRNWYQYYFHLERGVRGLEKNRRDIARLLWTLWSPEWTFDDATFERTALAFDNPDFVAVVIQSYRHRYGNAPGDPSLLDIEARLAGQPKISVPTINLHGGHDGVSPVPETDTQGRNFTGFYERRIIPRVGHNVPQEAPADTVQALRDILRKAGP